MRDDPDTADLLELAHEAISRHVLPGLSGNARFQALMALKAIGIALRQVETGAGCRAEALQSLRQVTTAESLDAANAALSDAIRDGEASEAVFSALIAASRLALAESDPKAVKFEPELKTDTRGS